MLQWGLDAEATPAMHEVAGLPVHLLVVYIDVLYMHPLYIQNIYNIYFLLNINGCELSWLEPERGRRAMVQTRDVNGASKPDYPRGNPLLGLGYELELIPMGIDLEEILSPSGMEGLSLGGINPNSITHGDGIPDLVECGLYVRIYLSG